VIGGTTTDGAWGGDGEVVICYLLDAGAGIPMTSRLGFFLLTVLIAGAGTYLMRKLIA
jgi:hypothetical protein